MEDLIIEEIRRDVFENPKPTIDLDYLYSVKRQVQSFADETNAQLKKNVYQNYSLFIESSREIATLKEEMRQLNSLMEQQQAAINKLLEQLNKTSIIPSILDRPKIDPFRLELTEDTSEVEAEMLPSWFTKSPEDFDVHIAQRNLREAVELAQRVKKHFEQYPKCCDNKHADLKSKIDSRLQELVVAICSELQPAADRSIQGGPRSSITSIQLLRELKLSSRAVKLYLDHRTSVLRFVLGQQKIESATTLQFIKQICTIFFHNAIETCNEFKKAFELDKFVDKALDEGVDKLDLSIERQDPSNRQLVFNLVRPIYLTTHPSIDHGSPGASNGNDISAHILNSHHHNNSSNNDRMVENSLVTSPPSSCSRDIFLNLATYCSLTQWIVQEFENFVLLFRKHVFNNSQLSVSMIAESIYHFKTQCSKMAKHSEIDMSRFIERRLENESRQIIEDCGRKLIETINKLDSEEQWQPQQFQNKAQLTRFFEEMNEVELKTMPSYIFEDLKLRFTACKTSFARCFLITVSDLAKVSLIWWLS